MGVRISWLMLARNSLLARLASSALRLASLSSLSMRLLSVTSCTRPSKSSTWPSGPRTTTGVLRIQQVSPSRRRMRYSTGSAGVPARMDSKCRMTFWRSFSCTILAQSRVSASKSLVE